MHAESERILQAEAAETSAPTVAANIRAHYRLESVVAFVRGQNALRIALQFPDHLLVDTPMVVAELGAMLRAAAAAADPSAAPEEAAGPLAPSPYHLFVLSDNTFGACCPDEITAAHYAAQCIVHFGYACMSRTNRLPVMYVAERGEFDVSAIEAVLAATAASPADSCEEQCCGGDASSQQIVVVLSHPARYLRADVEAAIARLAAEEDKKEKGAVRSTFLVADRPAAEEADASADWVIAGDSIPRLTSSSSSSSCEGSTEGNVNANVCCQRFIFVGSSDSPVLAQLAMICRFNDSLGREGSDLQLVTPATATEKPSQRAMATHKALRQVDQRLQKRMYNIEVLKGCASVGILVCTLAIKDYRQSAETLSKLIRRSGRKCYIVYIGHINEYKIANFSDSIDAFVVISCPHSRQAQFPQKDDNFMKPLCSPIEALIALGHAEFDDPQAYTTGFAECCAQAAERAGLNDPSAVGAPRLTNSSAAGRGEDGEQCTALLVRGRGGVVANFSQRTYKGLEARLGETEVQTELVQGLDGIAKGYAAEKEAQSQ